MYDGTLYAELLKHELDARFATPQFEQRVSYLSELKARVLHRNPRERAVIAPQRRPEPLYLPW